ncbi:LysR family transcriptional regulator [Pseudoalteromonas sp. JBTF-M23]|uniref:LysR family transcriptional regulator n=1 Tax=Pseudoalteromonas caenipelagi TaxID=2726988 RepID=A0A849VCZ2_9GAMM|nr:LysR family transcriptional regulator [Pseudoalteromonas caenipelagi]NOU49804.1 LysR family transcriptional regulator [Pseudoalteromonas caenipelagi]
MDWNSLKVLSLVARHGSISSAAKALNINYSTAFRRIEALEKSVGGQLFQRAAKGYVPTPLAEEMLTFAKQMLQSAENIERHIVGKEFQPKGVVKITAPYNIANRCLPTVIERINSAYPEITFEILASNESLNLNSRVADIAIRATDSPPEHLIGKKVSAIPWGMFVSDCFFEKYSAQPSLETLGQYPLIGGTGAMLNLAAFSWLEKHHSEAITIRCDELTSMSYFAQQGLGIAFLPIDQSRSQIQQLDLFKPAKVSDIWLLMHPDLRNTKRVRIVFDYLAEFFQSSEFLS